MKTATAWTGRAGERSAHKIAEKMAKNAGVGFDDWVEEAVAEYAEDLGVDPDMLDERERLEAIEERIDRLARAGSTPPQRGNARDEDQRPDRRPADRERPASRDELPPARRSDSRSARSEPDAERNALEAPARGVERRAENRDRLAEAIEAIERRTERNEKRTTRALESLTGLVDSRGGESSRLEETIKQIEKRAERNEQRTARALESLTGLVDSRGGESSRLEETIKQIEKRAERNEHRTARALESLTGLVEARGGERVRLEETIKQIEKRAERNEERTALALESLTGLVEARGPERERLEETIKQVELRAERNAERTARAIESLAGLVGERKGERERLEAAIERIGARASESEARTASALQSLTGLVKEKPLAPVEAVVEPAAAERPEAPASRPVPPPDRRDSVGTRLYDLARRAAARPRAGDSPFEPAERAAPSRGAASERETNPPPVDDEDGEALRLVAERLARRKRLRGEAPKASGVEGAVEDLGERVSRAREASPDPASLAPVEAKLDEIAKAMREHDLSGTVNDLQRDLRTLAEKIDALSGAALGSTSLDAIRGQVKEIEGQLRAASENAAPVDRLERQIAGIGERIDRLSGASPRPADIAAALKTLADAQSRIERAPPVAALATIERRIDELGGRIEEAARRPTLDPRPLEELARRVEKIRVAIERQGAGRPDSAALVSALQVINEKLDRTSAAGAQSASTMTTLQEMTSRLEEALQRPAAVSLDARPIEDLARRIEGVRGVVERQGALAPKVDRLQATLGQLAEKVERPAATAQELAGIESALKGLAAQVEAVLARGAAVDMKPVEDLAMRIDTLRQAVESNGALAPYAERLESSLAGIRARLDTPLATAREVAGIESVLKALAQQVEAAVGRSAPADMRPVEDLARRIDALRQTVESNGALTPHAQRLESALADIRARLDRPLAAAREIAGIESALRALAEQVEASVGRSAAIDTKPIEDLARRIDGVRQAVENNSGLSPQVQRLEAALSDIRARLDRPLAAAREIAGIESALRALAGQVEASVARSAAVDTKPVEDLAKRIDGVRQAVENNGALAPQVQRLEAALTEIRAAVSRPVATVKEIAGIEAALKALAAQVEAALSRSAAVDLKPVEDLARRIDGVRKAVESNGALAPQVQRLETALADICARLDRPQQSPQIEAVDATLRRLAAKFEEAVNRPAAAALDTGPIEDLARRIDSMQGAVERQEPFAPHVARLEAALGEIREKLDQPAAPDSSGVGAALRQLASRVDEAVNRPTTVALDPKPIEDLARRIESVRESLERPQSFAPQVERLETALGVMADKLDRAGPMIDPNGLNSALAAMNTRLEEAFRRPAQVEIDFEPIDALARRVEAVRETVERQSQQIDVAGRPIDELAKRLEGLRESVDKQAEQLDAGRLEEAFRAAVAKLDRPSVGGDTVVALTDAIERLAERVDLGGPTFDAARIETLLETVVARLERETGATRDPSEVLAAVSGLSARIDRNAPSFDVSRVESLLEHVVARLEGEKPAADELSNLADAIDDLKAKIDRGAPALDTPRIEDLLEHVVARLEGSKPVADDLLHLADAIYDLKAKIDRSAPAVDTSRIEDLLEHVVARLEGLKAGAEDLSGLAESVSHLATKIDGGAPAFDASRIEDLLAEFSDRLDLGGRDPADMAAVAGALSELSDKIDRMGAPTDLAPFEDLLQDAIARLDALDAKVEAGPAAPGDSTHLELAIRELTEKLGETRAGVDMRGVEQEIRLLQDKVDDLADVRLADDTVRRAADLIAQKIEHRASLIDPTSLLGHVQEIHERLDDLKASRPAPSTLDRAIRELTEELEAFRSARETVVRTASTLADLRADQMQLDRRIDSRFSAVQDILEKVVDRLDRAPAVVASVPSDDRRSPPPPIERPEPEAAEAQRPALREIPDRAEPAPRATAAVAPLAAQIAAQGRAREAPDDAPARAAALSAHIAAARRVANAAAAEMERREERESLSKAASKSGGNPALSERARSLFSKHRSPMLLGAAAVMTVLTGVAVYELRGHGSAPRTGMGAPTTPATPLSDAAPPPKDAMSAAFDPMPTGTLPTTASKVSAEPLPAPAAKPANSSSTPPSDLIAALPAGLPTALAAAGSNGDIGAEVEIAQRYLEGRGIPRDTKMAAGWLQAAAEGGSPFAQYRIGALYEKGTGVARDAAKAREWYTKSANAGNARAMHNLAVLYAQDGGTGKPDYASALEWFRKAGAYGVRDSQFNLGVLYGRGLGAPQDLASAWMWFSLAAKQGDADAARKRDEVANKMDGRVMATATKMLGEFKIQTPAPAANDAPAAPAGADASATPAPTKTEGKGADGKS